MKRQLWNFLSIGVAIVIVGLIAVGVPASTVLLGAVGLVCVLMMITMTSGMHGDAQNAASRDRAPGD
jgi:hypothetical protein